MKVIVFSDGACRGNPGQGAIGGVIKDDKNCVLAELSLCIGQCTNNIAEYKALIAVLQKAKDFGALQVEALADSELLVKQVQGKYAVKSSLLRPLYLQVVALASSFLVFTIKHIPRDQNKRADELANLAFRSFLT